MMPSANAVLRILLTHPTNPVHPRSLLGVRDLLLRVSARRIVRVPSLLCRAAITAFLISEPRNSSKLAVPRFRFPLGLGRLVLVCVGFLKDLVGYLISSLACGFDPKFVGSCN